jgi:DEAD/DEAH box helicase domain-containing protein
MKVQDFLAYITSDPDYRGQIAHHQIYPARPAEYGEVNPPLPETLTAVLKALGIHQLYSHQASAIECVRAGNNMVVVTATASGKTLCYNLPVLESYLNDPQSTALYLYPTKALAQDQLKALLRLTEHLEHPPLAGAYDGDTSDATRKRLRDEGRVILTNPDMLHQGILPKHAAWGGFFGHLKYVVIDEVHSYRGVFGSHVANVLRRLQRICEHYGSHPIFICTSATIANPREHAEGLIGQPVVLIENNGAPQGERHVILWNPPFIDLSKTERRSANTEAAWLMTRLIGQRIPTIAFTRARVVTELIYRYVTEELTKTHPSLAQKIRPYRGGYLPAERREIERQLFSGELLGVTSTNALELGIDIGSLEACLVVGYPGTIASFWQQAGRAGRGTEPSLVVFIGHNAPIDQYLLQHESYLFDKSPETAVIDPDNPHILLGHLRAAVFESPLGGRDERIFGEYAGAIRELLTEAGEVAVVRGLGYWRGKGFPAAQVALRNISDNTYNIIDEAEGHRTIGTMDEISAWQQLYTQAIYLHEGETYFVRELNTEEKIAYVHKIEADYYTQSITEIQVKVLEQELEKAWRRSTAFFGSADVMLKPYLFRKIKFGSRDSLGFGSIDLPPCNMETYAFWLCPPLDVLRRVRDFGRDPIEGLLGIANVLTEVLPLLVMSDPSDIGSVVDQTNTDVPSIFVYDKYPGGAGFAQRAYERIEELFASALELIRDCPCREGCPSCVGSPIPPFRQLDPENSGKGRIPDKEAALVILHDLLEREPYIPRQKAEPSTPLATAAPVAEEPLTEPEKRLSERVELKVRKQLLGMQKKSGGRRS